MQTCGKIIWMLKKKPDTLVYSKGMAILTNARYISRGQSRTAGQPAVRGKSGLQRAGSPFEKKDIADHTPREGQCNRKQTASGFG